MSTSATNSIQRQQGEKGQSSLLRLFAISALVSIVVILLLVGLGIFYVFNLYVVEEAENDAVGIGQALVADELQQYIQVDANGHASLVIGPDDLEHLDHVLYDRLQHFKVLKVKVYNDQYQIIYCNEHNIIGQYNPENPRLHTAMAGVVNSKLEHKRDVWDLANERKFDLELVETYLPVVDSQGDVVGSFEIYMEVTAYETEMRHVMAYSLILISLVLTLVFGILFLLMKKATRIIYSKSEQIQVLSGLLPICSSCKKIRNDQQEWEPLEEYISERSDSEFTHSLCPDCMEKFWGER